LIAKGLSYGEASQVLGISKNTLPVHIRNIYRKLHANNRSEAVFEARAIGVLE
jgi:DNA-binding CsgD family transcriptional regulator